MSDLIVAIGLVFVLEGLIYAVFPGQMKAMILQIIGLSESSMRTFGLIAIGIGVFIVWMVRG